MKMSLGLCLFAVVLSVGEASRTYRGAFAECKPGQCLVKDGLMCRCGEDGTVENAQCIEKLPPFAVRSILSEYADLTCTCTPGEVFHPKGFTCTCPETGEMTPENCVPAPRRSMARRRSNSVRSRTYRKFGPSCQTCEANACVIHEGKLCACGENGEANPEACYPPAYGFGAVPSMRRGDSLCTCEPGTVFAIDGYECVCPEDGEMVPEEHCAAKRSRYGL